MTPIEQVAERIKAEFLKESTGHDWWHIYRVWNTAKAISKTEGGNSEIIELGALLHDIADWKFHDGNEEIGPQKAEELLKEFNYSEDIIIEVQKIIREISFKGAKVKTPMSSKEGQVVQDADRLDAIGAIGIARAFAYGGSRNRELHNPEEAPILHQSFEEYKKSKGTTINHFHEKLLFLKDRMNTETGKQMAEERHKYMEGFLGQFDKEWNLGS